MQFLKQYKYTVGCACIKISRCLVSEYYNRIIDQCSGDCHSLHLSARHFGGALVELVAQTHLPQRFGSTAAAWQNMAEAITDRISLTDDAVRAVTIGQVLAQYFVLDTEPVLQLGPAAVTAGQLLLFGLAVGAVSVVIALRRGVAAQLVPLGVVWLLSLAAPASWMVLSKAHAAIHTLSLIHI